MKAFQICIYQLILVGILLLQSTHVVKPVYGTITEQAIDKDGESLIDDEEENVDYYKCLRPNVTMATQNCSRNLYKQFWDDCDWGLVEKYRNSLEMRLHKHSSRLLCTTNDRYCQGKIIKINFNHSSNDNDDNIFHIESSWTSLIHHTIQPWDGINKDNECTVYYPNKVLIVQPDNHANLYHVLCEYINIYASIHIINDWTIPQFQSRQIRNFDSYKYPTDLQILIIPNNKDNIENFHSTFIDLYKSFTNNTVQILNKHWKDGSTLCFDNVVFNLQSSGYYQSIFYNMYVPGDCFGSRFVRSFADYVTSNNNIYKSRRTLAPRSLKGKQPIQLSILTRNSGNGTTTGTRHIMNQNELIEAIEKRFGENIVNVQILDYDFTRVNINKQIQGILDTDILVSMHSAALAHLLFLPLWAVVFEIYNCGDMKCYYDLSRLKGIKYITMLEEHVTKIKPTVSVNDDDANNPKFWNYNIHVKPFLEKIHEAIDYITLNPSSPYYECGKRGRWPYALNQFQK